MRPTEDPGSFWVPQSHYQLVWPDLSRVSARSRPDSRLTTFYNLRDHRNMHIIRLGDVFDGKHVTANELLKRFNIKSSDTSSFLWNGNIAPDYPKSTELQRYHGYSPGRVALTPPETPRVSHAGGGGSAAPVWGGWACGAVLLALLVLIVRAAEKCVDKRLFHSRRRRRQSIEWPAAHVRATSLQQQNDLVAGTHVDEIEFSNLSQRNSDLPPPYSECASNNNIQNAIPKIFDDISSEEPPPPYSECLVAFSNKDIPTIHIHGRHIDEPQTSSSVDNNLVLPDQRVDTEQNNSEDECMRVELVFDNGRIVERTIDIDSVYIPESVVNIEGTDSGNVSTDSNVRCNDDSATENEHHSQNRVVFV